MDNVYLDDFASLVKSEPSDSHFYGQVTSINADGSYQVKLGSSSTTTRCAKLTHAAVGDVVLVVILRSGQCAVLGVVGGGGSMSLPVAISDGGTGATTAAGARNNLEYIGQNPVTLETDTTATWEDFGTGVCYFNTNGLVTDQPSRYGILANFTNGTSNVFQLWNNQPRGITYSRCGNNDGWGRSWKAIPQIDLLWTNSSPTSSFGAQTVSLDLSGYDKVLVSYKTSTNAAGQTYNIFSICDVGFYSYLTYPTAIINRRPFCARVSGVVFSAAVFYGTYNNYSATTDNNNLIPYQIYGVKGVN